MSRAENMRPSTLYHGTPYEIHTSQRPFLDPSLARGTDEGDPKSPHVMATPDELIASIFAFKDLQCRTIIMTNTGPIAVFNDTIPNREAVGFVYEVPTIGFKETLRRGVPSGKYAMVAEDMSLVTDDEGKEVPGISLVDAPVRKVTLLSLIEEYNLRIYFLADDVDREKYLRTVRDACACEQEDTFVRDAVERGWLTDVTDEISK